MRETLYVIVVEFCNEWPKALSTDETCNKLFPVEVITRDVVVDGSSVRDPRARLVTVKVYTDFEALTFLQSQIIRCIQNFSCSIH